MSRAESLLAAMSRVESFRRQGFDHTKYIGNGRWKIKCSACEAVTINGVPCHELQCPRIRKRGK